MAQFTGAPSSAIPTSEGLVRIVVSASDPGVDNWLDTGGRQRGFVIVRWLDNPSAPPLSSRVVPLVEIGR